jgi:hypothetical protein
MNESYQDRKTIEFFKKHRKKLCTVFVIIGVAIILFLMLKNEPKNIDETESLNDFSASEYIPSEDINYFAQYVFDDNEKLGLAPASSTVGYKTGLSKLPSLTWQDRTIFEEKPRVSVDIHYPQFNGGASVKKLNVYIETKIKGFVEKDRIELAELVKNDPESFESTLALNSQYRIIGVQNGIVSLELGTVDFTGGGNGNHDTPYVINWDLKSDKLIETENLFCSKNYLSVIAPIARKQIIDRIPEDLNPEIMNDKSVYESVVGRIESGTEPESDNFNKLLPYNEGLIVVFDPYQVHSGASGIVRTFIPKSAISGLICLP